MNWVRAASLRQRGDGNVLLHETFKKDNSENTELTTWVFEGFVPTAKLVNGKAYSIISDHLGTPILAIDSEGNEVWNRQLDIYGRVKREIKASSLGDDVRPFIPFLYQGQYYDFETKLAYNRFRYYSPETGAYISQDPIRLAGGNPTIYGYVKDSNWWLDVFGLDCSSEIMANIGSIRNKKKDEIRKMLEEQGFTKSEVNGNSEIWLKAGDDEKTVAVRLDPPSGIEGFVSNIPHAHKEMIPSNRVVNGNYPQSKAKTFDDSGNRTYKDNIEANHIPIVE